jgi:hypothetical protein
VRDEELCIIPDTIDELLIALQTSPMPAWIHQKHTL